MASGKNSFMNNQHYKNQNTKKTYHNASNATKNAVSLFKQA